MTARHAYLAMIMAFTLGACGQDDGGQQEQATAGGAEEQAAGGSDSSSNQYFEAAAKVGEVKDSGLGYDYVIVESK